MTARSHTRNRRRQRQHRRRRYLAKLTPAERDRERIEGDRS